MFPPGEYVINIVGTNGAKTATAPITLTLDDPCPTTAVSLTSSPFPATSTYTLRDPQLELSWSESGLLTKATSTACGDATFEILNSDNSNIDLSIFSDARDPAGNDLIVL